MAENFPGISPDFSSLAEIGPPTPEKKDKKKDKRESKKPVFESIKEPEKDAEKIKDDKPEKKEPTEKEAPIDKLGEEEERFAASEIADGLIQERKDEVQAAPADSVDEQVALVGAAFAEDLKEEVLKGKAVDEALAETEARTLKIVDAETPDVEDDTLESSSEEEAVPDAVPSSEPSNETPDDEDKDATAAISPASSTTSGGSGLGGATPPPVPPHGSTGFPPYGSGGSGTSGPGGPGGSFSSGGNIPRPTPNMTPNNPPEYINVRRSNRRHLLVGGLVGYMIGRRRGRIKTEKKLLPIQQKLEKEVKTLEQKIITREEKIRTIAREQLSQKPELQKQVVERLKVSRERSMELREKTGKIEHKEKIGKFALAGERPFTPERQPLPVRFEVSEAELRRKEAAKFAERLKAPEKPKTVEQMVLPDLLLIAEQIKIEGSSVKRLYETNRLTHEGLRRVVKAYLGGERFERTLRDNLVTPEKFVFAETLQKTAKPGAPTHSVQGGGTLEERDNINHADRPSDTPSNDGMPSNAQAFGQPTSTIQQKNKPRAGVITASVVGAVALILYLVML